MTATVEPGTRPRLHRAWWVAGITMLGLISAAAFRSTTGVMLEPLEADFGWTRATTSGAVSLNLIVYGVTAPFAAALMERFGIRRVATVALGIVSVSMALTLLITSAWQLWVLWGFGVGIGTGALALTFGAVVANRWFVARRGLVIGVFSAASSTGQLVFLPAIAQLANGPGWRWAAALVGAFALVLVPLTWWLLRDRPADLGLLPYGVPDDAAPMPEATTATTTTAGGTRGAAAEAVRVLRDAARTRTFWALFLTFWICGWSTNGLIGTHFIPAAHDHGMPPTTSASLLALIGIFDIAGTVASGWLTDRVDSRYLLVAYYALRGLSLLVVPSVLADTVHPSLFLFIVFYGLDWVATVPPTVALCRQHFGVERSAVVFGWVYASHMVGAGVAASFAGWIRQVNGDYFAAWMTAGGLCLAAAGLCLVIPKHRPGVVVEERVTTDM